MLTPARLYEIAMNLIASNGEVNNCGPDSDKEAPYSGTQALALYQDIIVSTALNDILRVEDLLTKAQNVYGI